MGTSYESGDTEHLSWSAEAYMDDEQVASAKLTPALLKSPVIAESG
jgi:hypothetical protein